MLCIFMMLTEWVAKLQRVLKMPIMPMIVHGRIVTFIGWLTSNHSIIVST